MRPPASAWKGTFVSSVQPMSSAFLLLITTGLLAASAGFVAASLKLRSVVGFLLAVYLLAFGEVVVLTVALSPLHLVVRVAFVVGSGVFLVAGLAVWRLAGRPPPPSARPALRQLVDALRDPALFILAAAVAGAFGYLAALAVWTPANSWDAMWYHLARAAFWNQQHAVAYIAGANDARLNANPPVGEIGALFTMVVAASDRFVTLVALTAYCVTTLAVFGIARRLLIEARAALLGALAFATLPVIVLQASGALNDLVVAAFLCTCVYFLLGDRPADIALTALALGLALGTKLTAAIALPILVLIAVFARKSPRTLALAGAVALVVASGWYIVNFVETGVVGGHLASQPHSLSSVGLRSVAATMRLLIDFAEVPGAVGWWTASYVVAAVIAAGFAIACHRRTSNGARAGTIASIVALTPLAVLLLAPTATRGYQWVWFHLGQPDLGIIDQDRGFVGASALASFFGPLGPLLLLSIAAVPLLIARTRLPRVALPLASAPLIYAVTMAAPGAYDPYLGRFFMFPVGLATAVAAATFRNRPLALGVSAVATTTLLLTLIANDEKPPSVWGQPRWKIQIQVAGRDNGEKSVIRFVEESIGPRAHIGLALRSQDWSYPFFGSNLRRKVSFVPKGESTARGIEWLIAAPGRSDWQRRNGWTLALRTYDGWRVLKAFRGIDTVGVASNRRPA